MPGTGHHTLAVTLAEAPVQQNNYLPMSNVQYYFYYIPELNMSFLATLLFVALGIFCGPLWPPDLVFFAIFLLSHIFLVLVLYI